MDNRHVKCCLKILSRFGKIIRKPQGVKFLGAPCTDQLQHQPKVFTYHTNKLFETHGHMKACTHKWTTQKIM